MLVQNVDVNKSKHLISLISTKEFHLHNNCLHYYNNYITQKLDISSIPFFKC